MREEIEAWLPEVGFDATPMQVERMEQYLRGVQEGQKRVRLVGDASSEVLVRRHLGEALALGQWEKLEEQRIVDVGAGAGFLGLGLALGWPGVKTTLVESNGKKAAFLRTMVEELGLGERVEVRQVRLGEGGTEDSWELVLCRALDRMNEVPGWLGSYVAVGGSAVFWITRGMAEDWRAKYGAWAWGEVHALAGSEERVIVKSVPRGTKKS